MSSRLIPENLPAVYPPRQRDFAYVVVTEPHSFVLFKAYNDNCGTVRLCEFKTRAQVEQFVSGLPPARRVWL
jgi:hypothetical protein